MNAQIPQDRTVEVGIFTSVDATSKAVQGLLDAGFGKDEITVICSDEAKERMFQEFEHQEPAGTYGPKAMIAGGAIGAVLGAFAVFIPAAITGSLALLAAGGAGAWTGGVAGGLVGLMMTRGVEKELANYYQQAVLDGELLVAAEADGDNREQRLAKAANIFAAAGAKPLPLRED